MMIERSRTIIALTSVLPPSAKEPAVTARTGDVAVASHTASKERKGRIMKGRSVIAIRSE